MRAGALTAGRIALAVLCSVMAPHILSAQPTFLVTPSLNVAVVSDSNLFARPTDPQGDVISRVSPAIDAEYRSTLLTVLGRFTVDAERFAGHQTLTTLQARRHAGFDFRYRPAPRLTFSASAALSTTETPGELNVASGVTLARASARRLEARPVITFRLDPVTEGTVQYAFTHDRVEGGVRMTAHTATVTGERQMSARDAARVDYIVREFVFESSQSSRSHTVTVGWTHDLTRRSSVSVGGGPRVGDGGTAPELSASVSYRGSATEVSLAYARTQTTLIGLSGVASTDSLTAAAIYGRPTSLRLRIAPGVMQTGRAGAEALVYRLGFGASHPLGRVLHLEAGYDVTVQRGDLYAALTGAIMMRHVIVVSLAAIRSRVQP